MMERKRLIPLAAMEQIMKLGGAERVSEDAKVALKEVLEDYAIALTKEAVVFAEHARRKTLKAEDIRLACRNI